MHPRLLVLCLLVAAVSARHASSARSTPHLVKRVIKLEPRQLLGGGGIFGPGSTDSSSESSSTSDTTSDSSSSRTSSSTSSSSTSSSTSSSSSSSRTTTSYQSTFTTTPTRVSSTTDSAGSTVVVTQTVPQESSSSSVELAPATSSPDSADSQSSGGSHTGLIIGVSVVGGVAVLGALIFLYMKFGGRRFSDYQDEDTDIKWPELKADGDAAAMQPLPARRTGGAGFDMGNEFEETRDGDAASMAEYGNKGRDSMSASTTALNAGVGTGAAYYGAGSEGAYQDDTPTGGSSNHYSQPGVAGFYDPYSGYPSGQSQAFYPEQAHDEHSNQQYGGYEEYHQNQADPFGAARAQASSVSPPMQPYRVAGQGMHQGF